MGPDSNALRAHVERVFRDSAAPALERYIAIPNRSPLFDPDWRAAGHMERAVELVASWCADARRARASRVEVVRLPGPHAADLARGAGRARRHRPALRPPRQAARDGGLGRGARAVDAGAARRPALRARRRRRRLRRVRRGRPRSRRWRRSGSARARCVALIEACEESGSFDLPAYVEHLARAHRPAEPRRLPRLGLRQLRAALGDDLAARHADGHAARRRAHRGRALRRRERRRAVELPDPAPAALAHRGRGERRDPRPRAARRRCRPIGCAQAEASAAVLGAERVREVPVRARHARRSRRTRPRSC